MSEPLGEGLRRVAEAGIELPCRAIVRSSRADSMYVATVEVLDLRGQPTKQVLEDVPLDPLHLMPGGVGVWAPPAKDQIVAVAWMGGSCGHPVVTGFGDPEAAKPRLPVDAGEHSIQGETWDLRHKPDEVLLYDANGAVLSAKNSRFKLAAEDDLLTVFLAWLDALIAAQTVNDTDTASGSPGRELNFNIGTQAALTEIKNRLQLVLRT